MKKSKKLTAVVLAATLALGLTACGGKTETSPSASASADASASGEKVKIGILQYATHASLDDCYKGIVEGLKEQGYVDGQNCTIDFVNGQGETETNNLAATNFVSEGDDIIIAIATPSATACYGAAKDKNIPVVFSACSDPVGAGLVTSLENPGTGATGTSDSLNFDGQLKMIRAMMPNAKTIGVLYTTSEANSVSQLKKLKELAPTYGFEIVDVGVTDASEVATGAQTLVSKKVDCIDNLTDNNVVNNLQVLLEQAGAAGIPVYGSEEEQVKNGCLASVSLDYVALGKVTGEMAVSILSGADAAKMPVRTITDAVPVINRDVLAAFGLTLPDAYKNAATVVTNAE